MLSESGVCAYMFAVSGRAVRMNRTLHCMHSVIDIFLLPSLQGALYCQGSGRAI